MCASRSAAVGQVAVQASVGAPFALCQEPRKPNVVLPAAARLPFQVTFRAVTVDDLVRERFLHDSGTAAAFEARYLWWLTEHA